MSTALLSTVHVLVAATRCQYQWGYPKSHSQGGVGTMGPGIPIPSPGHIHSPVNGQVRVKTLSSRNFVCGRYRCETAELLLKILLQDL